MNEKIYSLKDLLNYYAKTMSDIDDKNREDGGVQRVRKGAFVESFARKLIRLAWYELGGEQKDLRLDKGDVSVSIKKSYLKRITNKDVIEAIKKDKEKYKYKFRIDVPVYIKDKLVMAVECKSYAENAMLKRILFDGSLIKEVQPKVDVVLFQLESQLGGDYSEVLVRKKLGSPSSHTLMSYFNYELDILTLLAGDRKVNKPIHLKEFSKKIDEKNLSNILEFFKDRLKKQIKK